MIRAEERVVCYGHPNVRAGHKSTFEITREENLSTNGTCIIGVLADKGAADLSDDFREVLCSDGARLETTLTVGDLTHVIISDGSAAFTLSHPTDLVWRRSTFVCPRTIGVCSDTVACKIPEEIITRLKEGVEMTVDMKVSFNPEAQSPSFLLPEGLFHTGEEYQCLSHKG
ncbi:DUF371 domain-containing protein [Methanoplanus endosymbiosus]|uniref:DUF371 domain-containing protein n=1 Tax=Methanoplanus endosymbiosus TaxID=33865 RepID=UPI0027E3936F|nr:DUF371 domain-containing protein [Methanoplanus endosymbiosus]